MSQFGWVDQDDKQRQAMLSVVELFKDEGAVDELGIGSIRDTLADALFPGTSVLLTRARYLLMIPWLLQQVADTSTQATEGVVRLRALEGRLIRSLLSGGEVDGVIGRQAKEKLKRMPSGAYWAAMGHYGLRSPKFSIEGLLRADISSRLAHLHAVRPDDPGAERDVRSTSLHPDLPPAPQDLLLAATLQLTSLEAEFLRDRIEQSTRGTLFAWLLAQGVRSSAAYIWEDKAHAEFPMDAADLVDAGRRFHTLVHGAALGYNSLLARARGNQDLEANYDGLLEDWADEFSEAQPLSDGWTTARLWSLMTSRGNPVRPQTQIFIDAWVAAVSKHGPDAATRPSVRKLIRQREIDLKRGRARLVNRDALNAWTGAAGLVRLDYRWLVARRLMNDILAPQGEAA